MGGNSPVRIDLHEKDGGGGGVHEYKLQCKK